MSTKGSFRIYQEVSSHLAVGDASKAEKLVHGSNCPLAQALRTEVNGEIVKRLAAAGYSVLEDGKVKRVIAFKRF